MSRLGEGKARKKRKKTGTGWGEKKIRKKFGKSYNSEEWEGRREEEKRGGEREGALVQFWRASRLLQWFQAIPYDLNHQNSIIKSSSVPAASLAQQPASLPLSPRTRGPDTGSRAWRREEGGSMSRENEIHWLLTAAVTSNYLLLRSGSHPTESFWL